MALFKHKRPEDYSPPNKKYVEIQKQISMGIYKQPHALPPPKIVTKELKPSDYLLPSPPDVHESSFGLPQRVYILGSGKNGAKAVNDIPKNAFVIALNKAVLIRPCDVWMIATTGYVELDWWKDAIAKKCVRVFGDMLAMHFEADYKYRYLPNFDNPPEYEWIPNICRAATVAGCALNLCRDKGVTEVIFCGVDMFGDVYYDGTKSIWEQKEDAVWRERDMLQKMIDMCKSEGMEIWTLSDTNLDLQQYPKSRIPTKPKVQPRHKKKDG